MKKTKEEKIKEETTSNCEGDCNCNDGGECACGDDNDGECGCGDDCECKKEEAPIKAEVLEDEDLNSKYLRLMADFQNYKKRSEKQKTDVFAFANEKIATQLLDVVDSFDRALGHEAEAAESFKEGMVHIFNQLKDVLAGFGVKEIEVENVEFNPNFHNAVMMEDTDAVESGNVSAVLQKGYTLNDKVIRPAMVKVAN